MSISLIFIEEHNQLTEPGLDFFFLFFSLQQGLHKVLKVS